MDTKFSIIRKTAVLLIGINKFHLFLGLCIWAGELPLDENSIFLSVLRLRN